MYIPYAHILMKSNQFEHHTNISNRTNTYQEQLVLLTQNYFVMMTFFINEQFTSDYQIKWFVMTESVARLYWQRFIIGFKNYHQEESSGNSYFCISGNQKVLIL